MTKRTSKSKAVSKVPKRSAKKAAKRTTPKDDQPPPPAEMQADSGQLINMNEAIKLLKTTRPTFYRWLRAGKLRGMKVGRQWRFEKAEIDRFLHGDQPKIELRTDITPLIAQLAKQAKKLKAPEASLPAETPVQEAIKLIVEIAIASEASDIHLSPHSGTLGHDRIAILRLRIDGVLQTTAEFDFRLLPAIIEQWRILASLDPTDHRPADGRMRFEVASDDEPVDLRLSFLPTHLGQSVTVRILLRSMAKLVSLDLKMLPYSPTDKDRIFRNLDTHYGLIIANGPAGCGKTTTLYALINHVNSPDVKIMTIEDPVEFAFPWMVQVQVNEDENVTFSRAIKAFLKSDPDVIVVGEIRGREALELGMQAALTGHLVLTSMHASDSAHALRRMVEIGIPAFLVVDATNLIISQRLVRQLCPECSIGHELSTEEMAIVAKLSQGSGIDLADLAKGFRKPVGCPKCKQLGYRGRTVIAETMEVSYKIGEAMRDGTDVDEIRKIAVSEGMTTMAGDGLWRAAAGETTIDEIRRVLALR